MKTYEELSIEELMLLAVAKDLEIAQAQETRMKQAEDERVEYWKKIIATLRQLIPKALHTYCDFSIPDKGRYNQWCIDCKIPDHLKIEIFGDCREGQATFSGASHVVAPRIDRCRIVYDDNYAQRFGDLGHAILYARDNFHLIAKREAELVEELKKKAEQEAWAAKEIADREANASDPRLHVPETPKPKTSTEKLIEALDDYVNKWIDDRQW